jgi:Stress responsive A/B Barrel Domain
MKLLHAIALFLGIIITFSLLSCDTPKPKTEVNATKKMLRHVVLFKFKDGTSPNDVQKVETLFRNLPSEISEIKDFEWGLNNSPENLNQGFTHCFFLSFASEADRAIYLPHPAHKAFGEVLTPFLDKVLVLDYWVK